MWINILIIIIKASQWVNLIEWLQPLVYKFSSEVINTLECQICRLCVLDFSFTQVTNSRIYWDYRYRTRGCWIYRINFDIQDYRRCRIGHSLGKTRLSMKTKKRSKKRKTKKQRLLLRTRMTMKRPMKDRVRRKKKPRGRRLMKM